MNLDGLDKKIQDLAINNYAMFITLLGAETLIAAKVVLMRNEGKSWSQICLKLKITMSQARSAYKNSAAKKQQTNQAKLI